jgi:hypothetical protein
MAIDLITDSYSLIFTNVAVLPAATRVLLITAASQLILDYCGFTDSTDFGTSVPGNVQLATALTVSAFAGMITSNNSFMQSETEDDYSYTRRAGVWGLPMDAIFFLFHYRSGLSPTFLTRTITNSQQASKVSEIVQ